MEILEQYGNIPIDYSTILHHFGSLKSPKDKISKLEKSGELIRLKKGKYLVANNIKNNPPSSELIANHLYGPSYVSFETALSFHGMIPEKVYAIKSSITKRRKSFKTPFGLFEYISVPEKYYSIGIKQHVMHDNYAFIMASPEKALCDLIITSKGLRFQSKKALRKYLLEDLRIDFENTGNMNSEIFREANEYGSKKKELSLLYQLFYTS